MKLGVLAALALVGLALVPGLTQGDGLIVPPAGGYCGFMVPATYDGEVWLRGIPPARAYVVTAWADGHAWSSALVKDGRYVLDVPGVVAGFPPCFEGGSITFTANGYPCWPRTLTFSPSLHDVDVLCVQRGG